MDNCDWWSIKWNIKSETEDFFSSRHYSCKNISNNVVNEVNSKKNYDTVTQGCFTAR